MHTVVVYWLISLVSMVNILVFMLEVDWLFYILVIDLCFMLKIRVVRRLFMMVKMTIVVMVRLVVGLMMGFVMVVISIVITYIHRLAMLPFRLSLIVVFFRQDIRFVISLIVMVLRLRF